MGDRGRLWRQCVDQTAKAFEAGSIVCFAEIDGAGDAACMAAPPSSSLDDVLADCRLHQRRPRQIQAAAFGHQQLVAQYRQIATAGHAVAENGGELRHAHRRRYGVVAKNPAEIVLIGKHFILQRQKNAGDVHEINQRQPIIHSDALGAEYLLARHRKECPGLDGGIVGDDHDLPAAHAADAGDDARRRRSAPLAIHSPSRPQS